jgi:hypothetical protein
VPEQESDVAKRDSGERVKVTDHALTTIYVDTGSGKFYVGEGHRAKGFKTLTEAKHEIDQQSMGVRCFTLDSRGDNPRESWVIRREKTKDGHHEVSGKYITRDGYLPDWVTPYIWDDALLAKLGQLNVQILLLESERSLLIASARRLLDSDLDQAKDAVQDAAGARPA